MIIKKIYVVGYNYKFKTYKFEISLRKRKSYPEIYIEWRRIRNAFLKIKKYLGKYYYKKIILLLNFKLKIEDKNFINIENFIIGNLFKKNIRKLNDVQRLFNFLISIKHCDEYNIIIIYLLKKIFKTIY